MQTDHSIVALLADVDGTLVTKEKVLTERAIEAVKRLRDPVDSLDSALTKRLHDACSLFETVAAKSPRMQRSKSSGRGLIEASLFKKKSFSDYCEFFPRLFHA